VCGESITWLVPHGLSQLLPSDVDYRVMLTFLEFDESLLRFVNFRLFHSLGLPYPPPMEHSLLDAGAPPVIAATAAVGASVGAHEQQADDGLLLGSDADGAHSRADDDGSRGHLFRGLVFFLARETNVHALSFVIRACGGRCGWAGPGSPLVSDDAAITHRVVDRPQQQGADALAEHGACSVQPQWVFDSLNFGICCPTQPYAPGRPLPPHLSPFVQPTTDGGYAPEFLDTVADWQAAARGQARLTERPQPQGRGATAGRSAEQSDGQLYSKQLAAEFRGAAFRGAARGGAGTGLPPPAPSTEDDVEAAGLSAALLPRKKKELFKAMQMGIAANNAKAERLRGRKAKLGNGRE
jgi:pescadillo